MITRKRNSKKRKSEISASWYVGYAEDEESVEAIMKKFKELEDFQNESNIKEEDGLTTEQLEEVFKRTSAFTLKSARLDEEYNALEIFRYENGIDEEWNEEDDYQIADDAFWDSLLDQKQKGKKKREKPEKVEKEKPSLLAKYKVMSVQVQDRTGNYFCLKKRVQIADPNLPTYIRIPAAPLSRSWARIIEQKKDIPLENYNLIKADIMSFDFEQLGSDFQAVYMDPPFILDGEIPREGRITMEQFANLKIPNLITSGFLFIWVEKELYAKLIKVTEKWGYRYVENIAWVKKNLDNTIAVQPSKYFNKSKSTCLIFRKEGELELRHQRNPDVEFDFVKPPSNGYLNERKPKFVYHIIETLLPTAISSDSPKLIELWAREGSERKHWTTIVNIP